MTRRIIFYKNYFNEFYSGLDEKSQEKVEYVLYIIRHSEFISGKFFKHLKGTNGLYEIRIQIGNNIYRIFCFFDQVQLVVLLHGVQKKSQKIPKREIEKAERLKLEYFKEKGG